jgi:SAM-dependent methyltransferase
MTAQTDLVEKNTMQRLKQVMPWWLKIAAKLIIKRIPYPYAWSQRLGLLRLGHMQDIQYALETFHLHYDQAKPNLPKAFTTLELGPGDSLASALIAAAFGSQHTWLVDVGHFAITDIKAYNDFAAHLSELNVVPAAKSYAGLADFLEDTHTEYLSKGLDSLRTIPNGSVDFVFSQAVMEHVPYSDTEETLRELFRIQAPGGIASHRIDLKDHLESNLHSLRFSQKVWESKYFRTSDFYTNRLRASQWKELFTGVGYCVLSQQDVTFPALPLPRSKMQPEFARFSEEELKISSVLFVVQK